MNPIYSILVFCLVSASILSVDAQEELSKTLQRKFKRDAARLALRLEAEQDDLRFLNVVIPRHNIEGIYSVLTNIYIKEERAKSIAKCNVHTFPNPSIERFTLIFERDIEWAELLGEGINETTSDAFNELLDDYQLIIDKHVPWNETQDAITIRSKEPLNMSALANEFYNIEGVVEIDLGIPKVSGNDIQINRVSAGWDVTYILQFGSFANKDKQHIWKYHVQDDGTITFIEESGAPIPDWMRCQKKSTTLALKS